MKIRYLFVPLLVLLKLIDVASYSKTNDNSKDVTSHLNQNLTEESFKINDYSVIKKEDGFAAIDSNGTIINQAYSNDKISSITYDNSSLNTSGNNLIKNKYAYDSNDNLISIENKNKKYIFLFDENSNFISGSFNGKTKYKNTFDINDNLVETSYPTGDTKKYIYQNNGIKDIYYNDIVAFNYQYEEDGVLENDYINNKINNYTYDENNHITSLENKTDNIDGKYEYDGTSLKSSSVNFRDVSFDIAYKENTLTFNNCLYQNESDENERKIGYVIGDQEYVFSYATNDDYDLYPDSFYYSNKLYNYEYSQHNNISTIYLNDEKYVEYEYDWLNQLISEYYPQTGRKISYFYDDCGNIMAKNDSKNGNYEYTYDDYDKMISIDGRKVLYDLNGNILSLNGSNYSWGIDKQLQSSKNRNYSIDYAYNSDGYRTSKIVNGKKTNYYLINSNVILEYTDSDFIYYLYDEKFNLIGFNYKGLQYFYIKNILGDVLGIVDESNNEIASYEYSAYGEIINITDSSSDHIAELNPYRYRGYRYDKETNLYYLNHRYYSPEIGRFLSEDDIAVISNNCDTFAHINLYSYGANNPIKYADPSGYTLTLASIGGIVASIGVFLLLCGMVYTVVNMIADIIERYDWQLGQSIRKLCDKIEEFVNAIRDAVADFIEKIRKSASPEVHHIVAKAAWRAEKARRICINNGIDYVSDEHNLVTLKQRFHRKLHTALYYDAVNDILDKAKKSRQDVYNALDVMKVFLLIFNKIS